MLPSCSGRFSTVHICKRKNSQEISAETRTEEADHVSSSNNDGSDDLVAKVISRSLMDAERAAYEVNVMRSVDHSAFLPLLGSFVTDLAWILVMPKYYFNPIHDDFRTV